MDYTNIRPLLQRECSFRDAIKHTEEPLRCYQMMGIATSRFSVFWNTRWEGIHKSLITPSRWMELLNISKALTKSFPTPTSLKVFCDTRAEKLDQNQYNLYLEGDEANYWISAQTIPGNYEIKVHCITKGVYPNGRQH